MKLKIGDKIKLIDALSGKYNNKVFTISDIGSVEGYGHWVRFKELITYTRLRISEDKALVKAGHAYGFIKINDFTIRNPKNKPRE